MQNWARRDELLPLCALCSWRCSAVLFLLLLAFK